LPQFPIAESNQPKLSTANPQPGLFENFGRVENVIGLASSTEQDANFLGLG
jgi:hypothetical protein